MPYLQVGVVPSLVHVPWRQKNDGGHVRGTVVGAVVVIGTLQRKPVKSIAHVQAPVMWSQVPPLAQLHRLIQPGPKELLSQAGMERFMEHEMVL